MDRAAELELMQRLLRQCRTIAVVGLSSDPRKDSYIVAHHLHRQGYDIVPINPKAERILGRPAHPSLAALPAAIAERIDLVNVFRPATELAGIVEQALAYLPNLRGIWAQKGITDAAAAARAHATGVAMIQDRCIRTQHLRLRFG
ncbi:MAG TPA: CoA-binding protein [Bacillota bacterium]